jgi:tRNA A-37 threonylcarbamoyl transferase component Bud32
VSGVRLLDRRWEEALRAEGLLELETVRRLARSGDSRTRHRDRGAEYLNVRREPDGPGIYLKWIERTNAKDLFAQLTRGRVPASKAECEARAIEAFDAAGLDVARPVAVGEESPRGFSFLLLEEVPDARTLEEVLDDLADLPESERKPVVRGIVARLAEVVRKLHGAGLSHPDLYAKHVVVSGGPEGRLVLVDLARSWPPRRLTRRRRARDLAGLLVTVERRHIPRIRRYRFARRGVETNDPRRLAEGRADSPAQEARRLRLAEADRAR